MTHRSNHRTLPLTAGPAALGACVDAVCAPTIVTITTGTTGHGMWTRAAS